MAVDILLCNSLFIDHDPVERRLMQPYFPLGLMYLAAVLREKGFSVAIFDGAFQRDERDLIPVLHNLQPAVVGISSLITTRRMALKLAEVAHRFGSTVVLGGPDPTGAPERYLQHIHGGENPVDIVSFDESELTIVELIDALGRGGDLSTVAGLRYRGQNGEIAATAVRPFVMPLDSLPFPARDLVDVERYQRAWRSRNGYSSLSIINTRGCPYSCAWCQKAVFGRTYRSRSAANVAEEMAQIKRLYNPDQIRVVDDITGVNRKWLSSWHDEVLKQDAVIPFECLSRVNLMDRDTLALLKDMGCKKIYFGAESGSQTVLDAMHKGARVEQIYRAAENTKAVGIRTYFFMMVGYPGEEKVDIDLSVKMLRQTLPDEFSTSVAYPLPGTPFYEQVRDRLTFDTDWTYDWDYTAENRLLFKRGKYNTTFYRWVVRLFQQEWRDARLAQHGGPIVARLKTKALLALCRLIVRVLAAAPGGTTVQFQPAEGR